MITRIRATTQADLPAVMEMYATARSFMQRNKNATQWREGYPSEAFIQKEIAMGHNFVCENEEGEPVGTFCFILGEDPTYRKIYEGKWLNEDELYGTVHRIASSGKEKGVGEACFRWCFDRHHNIRVDTHRDNLVMQHVIQKMGFVYCGIILVEDGSERLAYQKIRTK